MIRTITVEELWLTRECAESFFAESKLPGNLDFDYWVGRWHSMMTELNIGVIIAYFHEGKIKGILGGVYARCTMTGDYEAIEAFWYIMPEFRGGVGGIKMLQKFEKWAKARGAVRIKMMHLSDLQADKMRGIYTRMGYEPLEVAYSKNL